MFFEKIIAKIGPNFFLNIRFLYLKVQIGSQKFKMMFEKFYFHIYHIVKFS
jgi:hypothetical protein